jgi:hypothetical protein
VGGSAFVIGQSRPPTNLHKVKKAADSQWQATAAALSPRRDHCSRIRAEAGECGIVDAAAWWEARNTGSRAGLHADTGTLLVSNDLQAVSGRRNETEHYQRRALVQPTNCGWPGGESTCG